MSHPPQARPNSISIVMRSFNEGAYIRQTLQGIFAQAWKPQIELLIIDSGSTDGSLDIIREFNPHRLEVISKYVPGEDRVKNIHHIADLHTRLDFRLDAHHIA